MNSFMIFQMLCFFILLLASLREFGPFAILPAAGFTYLISGFTLAIDVLGGFYIFRSLDLCCEAIYMFCLNYIYPVIELLMSVVAGAIVIYLVIFVFVLLPINFFLWVRDCFHRWQKWRSESV